MITGEQKPIKEILEIIEPYKNLLILGCGTCVKTCFAGGRTRLQYWHQLSGLYLKIQVKKFK